ncbi:MAG: ferritin family protein [Pseudomonadota bacterium]
MRFTLDEIFAMAEEIERNGVRFYRRAAALDPDHRALFTELADWEVGHERLFQRMRAELVTPELEFSPTFDPENEAELYLQALAEQHVFRRDLDVEALVERAGDARRVILLAMDFERDSIVFYLGMKAVLPAGASRDGVDRLIKEEMGHIAHLGQQLAAL